MVPAPPYPATYYAATAIGAEERPRLQGDIACDVAVVGGGYCGLTVALHLAERGYDTVLLEAKRVGFEASGRNGGQLHTGQRKDQDELERLLGLERARRLWALAEDAKRLVRDLIARHAIACDLRDGMIAAAWKARDADALRRSVDHLAQAYGYKDARYVPKSDVGAYVASSRYHGLVHDSGGAHLHALNYAIGLARAAENASARIFEHSRATKIEPGIVSTETSRVRARFVVLACDVDMDTVAPSLGGYALPINSYILATASLGETRARALIPSGAAVADTKFVLDYYRLTADHRLLFGGGETYTPRRPPDLKAFVRKPMLRVFPQLADAAVDFTWSGRVGVTMSRLPHLGRTAPTVFFAHGFSGQGVALATLAGQLMAEAIAGTAERFDVFAALPARRFPGGRLLRTPQMVLGMLWFALRDRL